MPMPRIRLALAGGVAAALGLAGTALGGSDFKTQLISRASGAHGAAADNFSSNPAVSANGRFVAFLSNAANLSSADGPDADVFVRDMQRQRTIFASRASGKHGDAANAYSNGTGISADGRFVVFYTAADNLSGVDGNATGDVYVRDLKQNRTILVSRVSGKHGAVGLGSSTDPSISSRGRFVGFESNATNLSGADDDNFKNAFVRDLKTNRTILVSRASGKHGAGGTGDSFTPAISPNGRFVTFMSTADNLSGADDDSVTNVFVRDLKTNRTILVSRASGKNGAGGNGDSFGRSITADGRFVTFSSTADNLSGADANGTGQDVFVHDLQQNRTILVSRVSGKHGAGGNGDSSNPKISSDGGFVAFESGADNLSGADDDTLENIFLRKGPF
jgi:TolB protein